MSEIGNISKSYGKQVNISVANTYCSNVLNSTMLPPQSIIITAPTTSDDNKFDIGSYCLVATDANKTPVRLTYTIQIGNGLVTDDYNPDILKVSIDKYTLKAEDNGLQLNTEEMIDSSTIELNNDRIFVDTQNLSVADESTFGVVSIDNESTKLSIGNNLYVDTEHLMKANENSVGVITSDKHTIYIDADGVISVNTNNLSTATSSTYGVAKIDGRTIGISAYGGVYVVTNNLTKGSTSYYGIVKPDNLVVNSNNGTLYLNTDNVQHATNTTYGTMKIDGVTLVSNNGVISMSKYDVLNNQILTCTNTLNDIENSINKINEKLSELM